MNLLFASEPKITNFHSPLIKLTIKIYIYSETMSFKNTIKCNYIKIIGIFTIYLLTIFLMTALLFLPDLFPNFIL